MKVVKRYDAGKPIGLFTLTVPEGATLLSASFSQNTNFLWFFVDTSRPDHVRKFLLIKTDEEITSDMKPLQFLTTITNPANNVMSHLFERLR